MKICFFGVGGVGGYFGSLVTKKFSSKHDIYFVARGAHKDKIVTNGLLLKKDGGNELITAVPKICTDNVEKLPICDIVVVSIKSYDIPNAAREISKISNDKTVILPLLNGVDIYERMRAHLHHALVLPACVYVGTHIECPGVIYQKGGNCKIFVGFDPAYPNFYPETLFSLFKESGIDIQWEKNVNIAIWSKFMFVSAYGLMTATYDKTLGEILVNADLGAMTKAIMTETSQIAKALHIALPLDIVEASFLKANLFPFETQTSFQRDIEQKGTINEGDLFGGTLIRFGETLGIPTPNVKAVYTTLLNKIN